MSVEALVTILGMAAITYAIRAGGLLLANRLPTTGFVAAFMRHIPGAVLAALVAPAIANGGPAEFIGTAAAAAAYFLSRNLFVTMAAGVAAVLVARTVLGL